MNCLVRSVALCWLLLDFSVHVALAELTVKPRDAVSVVGKSTYFDCATTIKDREVHWSHCPIGSTDFEVVYSFGSFKGRYATGRFQLEKNSLTGASNLLITTISEEDAGIYECQDDTGHGNKSQAELIVLRSDPMCKSNMTTGEVIIGINSCGIAPEVVQFSCGVGYRGNSPPVLEWIRSGSNVPITEGVTLVNTSNNVTMNLTLEGSPSIDGQSFLCKISQSQSASNALNCSSGVLKVWHAFNDFSVSEKAVNESVTCQQENGFQSLCGYKWTRSDGKGGGAVVSTEPTMRPGSPGLYRCQIDCTVKAKPCSINGMLVQVTAPPPATDPEAASQTTAGPNKNAFIAVVVILILMIITFAVLVVLFFMWRKKRSAGKREKSVNVQLLENDKIQKAEETIQSLRNQLKEEQEKSRVGIEYTATPALIREIKTEASKTKDKSIKGLALLNNELYIISQKESDVEVYDSTSFGLRRKWTLAELTSPEDASACVRNRCIYISENKDASKEILRVDPDGKLINKWSTGAEFGRLSVSSEASVIVIIHDNSKLTEYSADGNNIRTYDLTTLKIQHPMHAVKLKTGKFIITHGYLQDSVHRICEVDLGANKITKCFGGKKGGGNEQLSNPSYLAVDREGSLMVADASNCRVVLLGSNFEFKREIVSKENKINVPTRILLDELNGRLYVGDYKSGNRVLYAFNVSC